MGVKWRKQSPFMLSCLSWDFEMYVCIISRVEISKIIIEYIRFKMRWVKSTDWKSFNTSQQAILLFDLTVDFTLDSLRFDRNTGLKAETLSEFKLFSIDWFHLTEERQKAKFGLKRSAARYFWRFYDDEVDSNEFIDKLKVPIFTNQYLFYGKRDLARSF